MKFELLSLCWGEVPINHHFERCTCFVFVHLVTFTLDLDEKLTVSLIIPHSLLHFHRNYDQMEPEAVNLDQIVGIIMNNTIYSVHLLDYNQFNNVHLRSDVNQSRNNQICVGFFAFIAIKGQKIRSKAFKRNK